MGDWTRRNFLKASGTAIGTLLTGRALALDILLPVQDPLGAYPYRGWETFYRDLWNFDYFGRVAHSVNCTGSCTWKVYVKNGIAFKEEQFADYPAINDMLPVYNPRGCQKGANHKEYVYGPQRAKYPLIRVGAEDPHRRLERGQGKWRRATWDEALGLIAGKILDAIQTPWTDKSGNQHRYGPDSVHFYAAIPAKHHITIAGGFRLSNLIGAVAMSFYDWYSDLPPGEPQTWGVQTDSCESADWVNSKLIMLMGANLLETRIPDAHYFTEARARGTKTVAVFPDYNPVSIHADLFVPIKPGTDGALCLGMAKYIIDNDLHDVTYIKQYTDMPFLVRTGPTDPLKGKFLRKSDAQNPDGSPVDPAGFHTYYVWDLNSGKAVEAPGTMGSSVRNIDLGTIDPALGGVFTINGVSCTTVFSLLKKKLMPFSIESVACITGLNPNLITELATDFATIKPARIIEGAGTNHWFHNDLTNRSQIMLLALTGNVGLPGSGFDHYVGQEKIWPEAGWFKLTYPNGRLKQRFQNTTLWTFVHSEIVSDVDQYYPALRPDGSPGGIRSYIKESVEKGWMPLWPKDTLDNQRSPKVLFIWGANYINQSKGFVNVVKNLLPKIDLIVDLNVRMDTSATFADVVLPAASMFEKFDLNTTDLHTFAIPFTPVIDPQFQSRTDWQIWRSLADAIQKEAMARGFSGFTDDFAPFNTPAADGSLIPSLTRDFTKLLQDFDTLNTGEANLAADRDAAQFILSNAVETQGFTLDGNHRPISDAELAGLPDSSIIKHPRRFPTTSEAWTTTLKPGIAYYGFQRMVEELKPIPTMVGRQQFYVDHDWYLKEFKEELPTYKGTVDSDAFPLRWSTPHGRWSIHSTWRDAKFQQRLQRARTVVYLNPVDAARRGLKDNDLVVVYNSHGSVRVHLDISRRIRPGQALMYHGWERYQNVEGWQAVTTIRINPTQLVGKYGQLTFRLNYWGPTGNQKDTRVEIVQA